MIHTLRIKHGSIATLTVGMCTFFFPQMAICKIVLGISALDVFFSPPIKIGTTDEVESAA